MCFFFHGASWVLGLLVLSAFLLLYGRGAFKQLWEIIPLPSFQLLALGSIIVIGWAQVLAQRELITHKMDDRGVEECLEAAGYILIFCGVIELYYDFRGLANSSSRRIV
jgi:hypothetical protein